MESIPDHKIEAFVDGELDRIDRNDVLNAMQRSGQVSARVAEIRRLKDLMKLAYQDEIPGRTENRVEFKKYRGHAIAAILGALSMLLLLQVIDGPTIPGAVARQFGAPVTDIDNKLAAADKSATEQVLFHLSSSDESTAELLLDQVEVVASRYAEAKRELRIIVIANNEGLRLFQAGRSTQAARISDLYRRYDNIVFAACGATLARFQTAGETFEILAEVIVVDSGIAEITRRQLVGWKYIRI